MRKMFQMTDGCEHGQHRFDEHPGVPRSARANFQILGIARFRMKSGVPQDDHLILNRPDEALKHRIGHIGGVCPPAVAG